MKLNALNKSSAAVVAALILVLAPASVLGKTPSDVADLVGAKGAGGEMDRPETRQTRPHSGI